MFNIIFNFRFSIFERARSNREPKIQNRESTLRGFTLVELLVVLAITAILLGLIFGPMIQGFNLTNRARVQVLAQDTARAAMEIFQRDIANGVFVFDNASNPVVLSIRDKNGNATWAELPYGMIDFVPPARVNDQNINVNASQIDPTTGLAIDRGPISLPLAPGRVMVRWWLGPRSIFDSQVAGVKPYLPYGNFYDNPRDPYVNGPNRHNPVILYRAIFSPYLPTPVNGKAQVDQRLFRVDANGNPILSPDRSLPPDQYAQQYFFNDLTEAQNVTLPDGTVTNKVDGWVDENGDGKVNICENWHALARTMVPVDRADEVVADRDDRGNLYFDANGLPRLTPQVRFQPTYVGNDAGTPTSASDTGNESPTVTPSSYVESHGAWTLPYRLYAYRSPLNAAVLDYYFYDGSVLPDPSGGLRLNIRHRQFDTSSNTQTLDAPVNFVVDKTRYLRSGELELLSGFRPEILLTVDNRKGVSGFAFPEWLVMHDSNGDHYDSEFITGNPAGAADPTQPNTQFATTGYRYINLGKMDPGAYLNPPLNPPLLSGMRPPLEVQSDGKTYIPNVRIVPGSEIVEGPDQLPGPHYGQPIAYTRVPRANDPKGAIGPNQYMINYTDDPNVASGGPTDLQKAGTIIFDSQPDGGGGFQGQHSLPTLVYGPIGSLIQQSTRLTVSVTYQIQNNQPTDVVKADYLTRQLITFVLGARLYDFNSGQPQEVTLTQQVRVRNLQR